MKEISVDVDHCLACKSCEVYCAVAHSASRSLHKALTESPQPLPRIKVKNTHRARAEPALCRHCKRPPCVQSCERNAIRKDAKTELTVIDRSICVGCETMLCISACPFGAIILKRNTQIVLVCDQCVDIGEPVCVQVCPTKVFKLRGEKKRSSP